MRKEILHTLPAFTIPTFTIPDEAMAEAHRNISEIDSFIEEQAAKKPEDLNSLNVVFDAWVKWINENTNIENQNPTPINAIRRAFYAGFDASAIVRIENANTHPLQEAFDACIQQVTKGKGERHGGDATPFFDQPWYSIAKQTGPTGLIFQSMKKAGEACGKPDQETFERELLGAIVYAAMAYLYTQKHGFKNGE